MLDLLLLQAAYQWLERLVSILRRGRRSQAIAPLVFGTLMDHGQFRGVWMVLVGLQVLLIASAFNVRRARRTVLAPVAA